MYSRTNSVTMTVQTQSFAFPRSATRSTQPEVFTFERITPQATAVRSYVPIRPKKRCTRVMYPAKVRMHLPPPEKNQAKRWLVILCLVVLWQIYTEEPWADTPLNNAECPVSDYQALTCRLHWTVLDFRLIMGTFLQTVMKTFLTFIFFLTFDFSFF
uniref:Zgc:158343 n=1 Tax=Labrus bergylta TaxID=56723 RepID=A0A3Q3F0X5_9LABR